MSFVDHKRLRCARTYQRLVPANFNNTRVGVLHVRNHGELPELDRTEDGNTWLHRSCELQGIHHVALVAERNSEEFAFTDKIPMYLEALRTMDWEWVIIADSTDSVITRNPDEAVELLDYYGCEVLYSTTHWWDYDAFTMPEQEAFLRKHYGTCYLNSGVCLGRRDTLIELFERVLDYAAFEPWWVYAKKYRDRNGYMDWSPEQLAAFPKGCSDDQTIIRYLVKEFWPRIKIDNEFKLAEER